RQLHAVVLDDLQQLADPRVVGDARADEPDSLLALRRELRDRVAQRGDAAMTHGAINLAFEAEATSAAAAFADLEQRHVAVLGVRRLHGRDGAKRVDLLEAALHDARRRATLRPHV